MRIFARIAAGAAAGAAGTTALNIVTYLDMLVRARPASDTPEETVDRLADAAHVEIPGDGDAKKNRTTALGALSGLGVGVGVGALFGLLRAVGVRPPVLVTGLLATVAAMIGSDGPIAALKISDPRTWSATDWASDVIPHLAYGVSTAAVLEGLDPDRR